LVNDAGQNSSLSRWNSANIFLGAKQATTMSQADKQALALRDLAVTIAKAKGVLISEANAQDLYSYHDTRLRIEYTNGRPQALDVYRHGELELKVLSVIWNDGGGEIVLLHRGGPWEDSLRRLAKSGV
jgi:hypothetical protein